MKKTVYDFLFFHLFYDSGFATFFAFFNTRFAHAHIKTPECIPPDGCKHNRLPLI